MKRSITLAFLALALSGCASNIFNVERSGNVKRDYVVLNATWYQMGKKTASGERFDPEGMTVAHRTMPFGTMLRITNPATGATVVARVNDRGPFVKGVSLDVSRGAARQLGMLRSGCAALRVEVLNTKEQLHPEPTKKYEPIDLETNRLQVVDFNLHNDDKES